MLIYNTTFHVEDELATDFLIYIKKMVVPQIVQCGLLMNPLLSKVLTEQEGQEGCCFALQFSVKNYDTFEYWFEKQGEALLQKLQTDFKNRVLFFSTFLDEISLDE